MSLRVWLPLLGDVKQQGCSNANCTNYGATVNTGGKIGSCYSFDGTDDYLQIRGINLSGWSQFSMSCWCNLTNSIAGFFLIRGSSAHRFKVHPDGVYFRDTNNSTARTIAFGATIPTNEWFHFACSYNRGEIYVYINGVCTAHNANYYHANSTFMNDLDEIRIMRITTTSSNTYCAGKINDFRIYDHALSAAEVREISQGLVLHYKLDDLTSTKVQDSSGYNNNGTRAGTISAYTDSPRYSKCMNLSATSSRINCGRGGMMKDAITVNFWANLPTVPSALSDTTGFVSCAESGGFRIQVGNNGVLRSIVYINSAYAVIEGTTTFQTNTWYMITLVYDRINSKLYEYINGIQDAELTVSTNAVIGYNSGNVIWIGVEARSGTSYYSAIAEKVSDFRIYATALSADDIKQLYELGAKVDNKQQLHTFELVEDESATTITKGGNFLCDELTEDAVTKLYNDNTVETKQLIEI